MISSCGNFLRYVSGNGYGRKIFLRGFDLAFQEAEKLGLSPYWAYVYYTTVNSTQDDQKVRRYYKFLMSLNFVNVDSMKDYQTNYCYDDLLALSKEYPHPENQASMEYQSYFLPLDKLKNRSNRTNARKYKSKQSRKTSGMVLTPVLGLIMLALPPMLKIDGDVFIFAVILGVVGYFMNVQMSKRDDGFSLDLNNRAEEDVDKFRAFNNSFKKYNSLVLPNALLFKIDGDSADKVYLDKVPVASVKNNLDCMLVDVNHIGVIHNMDDKDVVGVSGCTSCSAIAGYVDNPDNPMVFAGHIYDHPDEAAIHDYYAILKFIEQVRNDPETRTSRIRMVIFAPINIAHIKDFMDVFGQINAFPKVDIYLKHYKECGGLTLSKYGITLLEGWELIPVRFISSIYEWPVTSFVI